MNLIPFPLSYDFNYWNFTHSTLAAGGSQAGITVSTAEYMNPASSSNLTTQIVTDVGSYGGVDITMDLLPNTEYTISFSVMGIDSNVGPLALRLSYSAPPGPPEMYWNGSGVAGYNTAGDVFEYPPLYVPGTDSYVQYTWTLTTPSTWVTGSTNNTIFTIYLTGATALSFYGLEVNTGPTPDTYVEPTSFAYDIASIPYLNNYVEPYAAYYPSVDLYNNIGERLTIPFDPSSLATTTILGKNFIPYGNTFGKLLNPTTYAYTINPYSGLVVNANRVLAPVDPINNPAYLGYCADVLTPSSNPALLTNYSGATIIWPNIPAMVIGDVYTVSVWAKAKYLPLTASITMSPGGNWSTGIQSPGSEGNLADPAWKTLNGYFSIILQNDTNNAGLSSDEGIPSSIHIPTADLLFTKRADQISATPINGVSSLVMQSYLTGLTYDISTVLESTLPADVLAAKYGVVLYQDIPYNANLDTYNYDFWAKIAQDQLVTIGGTSSVVINSAIHAEIISWAMIYTLLDGSKVVVLQKWFDTLEGDSWRWQQSYGYLTYSSTLQDFTKPVGFGFVFSGSLSIYGGLRIYDHNPAASAPLVIDTATWTRFNLTFTATEGMSTLSHFYDQPGISTGSYVAPQDNSLNIYIFQPTEPTPNTTFLPWAPVWSAVELYGLMINAGPTPGIYFPDPSSPVTYGANGINPLVNTSSPTISYATGDITISVPGIPAWSDKPHHPIGINVTGSNSYSSALTFLNLMKLSTAGKVKTINDPTGTWVNGPVHGWNLYRSISVNGIDTSFNVLDTEVNLSAPTFVTAATTMTSLVASGDNYTAFNPTNLVRTLTGIGVAPNTKVVDYVVSLDGLTITWTVDTPFTGDSSGSYQIHLELVDSIDAMALDSDGYPTILPAGYYLYGIVYRSTPLSFMMANVSIYDMPYLRSGLYKLTWDGTGTVSLNTNISMVPAQFPATVVSGTSNSVIYSVDCSGNTIDGISTATKSCYGPTTTIPITDSQTGFVIAILSTDPGGTGDYVRNIKLFEVAYESNVLAGEIFYPEFISRLADFKCLRFLDWVRGNSYQPLTTIESLTVESEVSWTNNNMVPYSVIISLCNQLQKDCWLNVPPYSTDGDAFYKHIANLFQTTLDQSLRLYVEYGNEQWNGGLGPGYWLDKGAAYYGIVSPIVNPPNPAFYNEMYFYAMMSQYVFTIFDDIFSGFKGQLTPVRQWDNPRTQRRRLFRCLSTMINGQTITSQIWQFALLFTKGAYGIPYDVITPNAYIDILNDPTYVANQRSAAPAEYPWTMSELIPIYWNQANIQMTQEAAATAGILASQPLAGYPTGLLGVDATGTQFNPLICFYEGGMGCAGPGPHMLQGLTDLLQGYDGSLATTYNITLTQLEWWKNAMIPMMSGDTDAIVYNIWETAGNWGGSDQWGLADKGLYSDTEYYQFPKATVFTQSSGRMGYSTTILNGAPPGLMLAKPQVRIGNAWVPAYNVYVADETGNWIIAGGNTLNVWLGGAWTNPP